MISRCRPKLARWAISAWLSVLLLSFALPMGAGATDDSAADSLDAHFAQVFPGATGFGLMAGTPPAAAAYKEGVVAGYVFSTARVVESAGYSGKPLDILAGLNLDGRITGAMILQHSEPILVIGVGDDDLAAFVEQYRGLDIRNPVRVVRQGAGRPGTVDAVAGASISSIVFNDSILRAARAIARSRGILGQLQAQLDFESFEATNWPDLVSEGSLVQRSLTVADAELAVERSGGRLYPEAMPKPDPEATFLELSAGLATPTRVGRNLMGDQLYNRVMAGLAEGDQLIFVAGRGLFSFKGTAYVRDGLFDRLQLVQGDRTFRLRKDDHIRVEELSAEGAPDLRELALFVARRSDGFSPVEPWRLEVLIPAETRDGQAIYAKAVLPYRLPERYRKSDGELAADGEERPLWHQTWWDRRFDIGILVLALVALTVILVFQDAVARRRRLYERLRLGFLVFTLAWIGWMAGAQLSVLNVLTFANAMMTEFHWNFFLLEPLMFILWSYVAVAMLFWGRGVFCGWLCPFGALQELTNRAARWARVPQWRLPFALHERLWPIKYIVFLAIFAVFLGDLTLALKAAEVEPFKTAIVLRFDRAWPFVVYPLALLFAGLFVTRFFCRYLCPLGAALAIPARLRMFEWLKRRWQCGKPCQQCAQACPVQAIHPEGRINPNECVHCLNCQVQYHNDRICPPLIERRKRRERREAGRQSVAASG